MKFKILTFLSIISVLSCNQESRFIKGCCDNPVISEPFGNGYIYMANIFTPNGDNVNDWFYVEGDSIDLVLAFEIRDKRNTLVFSAENGEANTLSFSWDGKVDGVVNKGLYSFFVSVRATDGTVREFEGEVCNFPCGLEEGEKKLGDKECYDPGGRERETHYQIFDCYK